MNALITIFAVITLGSDDTPLNIRTTIPKESCLDAATTAQTYIDDLYLDEKVTVLAEPRWKCEVPA